MKTIYHLIFFLCIFSFTNTAYAENSTEQNKQSRISQDGHYKVTVESWLNPLRLGRMHAWQAEVKTSDGEPVTDATITVSGGMPIHNHGFPTQPEVTKQLEDGVYLIEGVKFSMRGPWVLLLNITSGDTTDTVAFDINM